MKPKNLFSRVICLLLAALMLLSSSSTALGAVSRRRSADRSDPAPEGCVWRTLTAEPVSLREEAAEADALSEAEADGSALSEAEAAEARRLALAESLQEIWALLLERQAKLPAEAPEAPVLRVEGWLPEDVTAQVEWVAYDEQEPRLEQALLHGELRLLDGEGKRWEPVSPLTVTVEGETLKAARSRGLEPRVYLYQEEQAEADDDSAKPAEVQKAEGRRFTVQLCRPAEDEAELTSWELERGEDRLNVTEAPLEVNEDAPESLGFQVESGVSRFALTGLQPERSLAARSEDGSLYLSVTGRLPEGLVPQIAPAEAGAAAEALNDDPSLAWSLGLAGKEGAAYGPEAPLAVTLSDPALLRLTEAGGELRLWRLEDGEPVQVKDAVFEGDSLSFESQGLGDYYLTRSVTEKRQTVSDGDRYAVSLRYDNASGIPDQVALSVAELGPEDPDYSAYVEAALEALGQSREELTFVKVFDIGLRDPETGEEFQPTKAMQVRVELPEETLGDYTDVSVVHLHGDEAEVLAADRAGTAVDFTTDSFSIYVMTGVYAYTYTYIFYVPSGTVNETVTETGFTVDNWSAYYSQLPVQTETGVVYTQTVKNGETPIIPQLSDSNGRAFAGWFEGSYAGTSVSFGKTAYDFGSVNITENRTINLYARFGAFVSVTFHDQYNSTLEDYPVTYIRRGELVNGTALVQISDVSATYSGDQELAFLGWSETKVQTPGNEGTILEPDSNGCISLTQSKDLYPIFQSFHWLSFYSARTGSGATYVPQAAYFTEDSTNWPTSLPVPEWAGHNFLGWFNGDLVNVTNDQGEVVPTVHYSTQITDAQGQFIPGLEGTGVVLHGGKLKVLADTTLYAKWSEVTTVTYKVIIWKQKTTDPAGLEDAAKHYDFVEAAVETASIGATVEVGSAYLNRSYEGFAYSRCDSPVTVDPEGYTVLNVYYDRITDEILVSAHQLEFRDSITGTTSSPSLPLVYDEVPYLASLTEGNGGHSYVPQDPASGRTGFAFSGWYADENCTTRVFFDEAAYRSYRYSKVLYATMPNEDLTVYAGWEAIWYIVQVDPNYGSFNGSGGTWFWETVDGDLVREYTQVTRNYVPSSSGTFFYTIHDRAYYGYEGNLYYDNEADDRNAYYTQDPGLATEDGTFEEVPGVYTYAGWYEVHEDGTETPYDFSRHVDHDILLRLHWKKSGTYAVAYDAGEGTLTGIQDEGVYADHSGVLLRCGAAAPAGLTFVGWRVRGDATQRVYQLGQNFTLNAEYAVMVNGRQTVFLDAVYTRAATAELIYDPNGGTILGTVDEVNLGAPADATAPVPELRIVNGRAIVSNLVNNSAYILSDGLILESNAPAFRRLDAAGAPMILAGWSTEPDYRPGDPFFDLGGTYGVDTEEPVVLYAVWQVAVTYHLNTDSAQAAWGGDWTVDGFRYDSATNTYTQPVWLNTAPQEPARIPTDPASGIFLYWTAEETGTELYGFTKPLAQGLDLYARWGSPTVRVHGADASAPTLAERDGSDGWTIQDIQIGQEPVAVTAASHVTVPAGADYAFAFAAVSDSLEAISEDNAVTSLFYNPARKQIYVTYARGGVGPLGDGEIYFVYYQEKALDIGYKRMDSAGVLLPESGSLPLSGEAPLSTGLLGSWDLGAEITQPKAWVNDGTLTHYSFALGAADAGNAGQLYALTTASDTDESRPALRVRNTWRGFQYTTDGAAWVSCGYEPVLYVVYYAQQPTVVMIREQTVGDSASMAATFEYQILVTQHTTDSTDPANPVVTEQELFSGTYVLPDSSGINAQSAILFYSSEAQTEVTQTITVTQLPRAGMQTTIDAGGMGAVSDETLSWSYTNSAQVEAPTVTFTNTQATASVEVHVARIDLATSTIVLDDALRSLQHTMSILPGETKAFLTALPEADIFVGNRAVYAFGAVVYGTDDGTIVTPRSLEVDAVSFAPVRDSVHELTLLNAAGEALDPLSGYRVYYLYYPMPQIQYVKLSADGGLSTIRGSLDGEALTDTLTYNQKPLTMNGVQVSQSQRFSFPMNGFRITQQPGTNTFRLPPILDDGVYARYLSYTKLAVGSGELTSLEALGADRVSEARTLYLQVVDNSLEWSFDGETWAAFDGTPTIYAIYEARGYDLQIAKHVPINVGGDPEFTVTLSSTAITKNQYSIEGYVEETISATPATGTRPGSITLRVKDGTSYKLKGLGLGAYTLTETGNANYDLTASCGPLHGTMTEVPVTDSSLSFSLDRERRLNLTNTSKAICKITVDETEHPFYTLQSAIEYVSTSIANRTATLEMLTDYLMPASDQPVIPSGDHITLTTAELSGGVYNFDGGSSGTASGATITRAPAFTSGSMITNRGTLTLSNLTLDGGGVEANSAMITTQGSLTLDIGTLMQNARNTDGTGGAIYASAGTVTVNSTIRSCRAKNGGAIYSTGSLVEINGLLSGNSAENGGAIYYSGTGTIRLSGTLTGNTASTGNGGAVYATAGTVAVNGGSLGGNTANNGLGGAVYMGSGAVQVTEGAVGGTANVAKNGAAIFVQSGSASFSGGSVTGNTAREGGAVGVGSTGARLYFSADAFVSGNLRSGNACNVYLDQDTDTVINAAGLNEGAAVGIYAAGALDGDLFQHRGVPGAKFGIYSSTTGITAFHNDRLSGITVTADTDTRRLVWGKSIQLQVRYMSTYGSGFPQKADDLWNGELADPAVEWKTYYLPANENSASSIADSLLSSLPSNKATASFACAFLDDGSSDIGYDRFITAVNWNSTENSWQFTMRDGSIALGSQLVVYYSEAAYINIENNTDFPLRITGLTLRGYPAVNTTTQAGYGYVFAKNGAVQSSLLPITAADLTLGAGKSVKLLFPGGLYEQTYSLSGGFTVLNDETIPVRQTGVSPDRVLSGDERSSFTLSMGKTGNSKGSTVNVIFGSDKPVCKLVTTAAVSGVTAEEYVGIDEYDEGGVAYLFSSISQAVDFAYNHSLDPVVVEMLTDYLIPDTDAVSIKAGQHVTITTAIGDTDEDYNYSSDPSARADISRDNSNKSSFIMALNGENRTVLTVSNLIFDGKNYAGKINGGIIKTTNCAVLVDNCVFQNCVADNGGGMFINFDPAVTSFNPDDENDLRGTLTVTSCSFYECKSNGKTREGGGAIWTNGRKFVLRGSVDAEGNYLTGIFVGCTASDQGGAVFHRIDWAYPEFYRRNSVSDVSTCQFLNCTAKAAGGLEMDAYHVTVADCLFESCQATTRNAGGMNVYIQERSDPEKPETDVDSKEPTFLTVSGCTYINCTSATNGGGLRSTCLTNTISDCTFQDNICGSYGGGISFTSANAISATVTDCVITGCSAKRGGGVYFSGSSVSSAVLTLSGDATLDESTTPPSYVYNSEISDCTATEAGGGVYTSSHTTLINTKISGNQLSTSVRNNAAGVYLNSATLTVGKVGAEIDTTVVTGNTISGGAASNVRLLGGSNSGSVVVNCDLSPGSRIGVTNPGAVTTQFGTSPNTTSSWRPYGLADPTPDDPDYYPTFVADDGSVYGIIDRSDQTGVKIIWGGPPICKITDAEGNLLYLDGARKYPAIFDALEGGANGSWTSAFALLRNPTLYRSDGTTYPKDQINYPYYVQMLVENYNLTTTITTTATDSKTIYLTTASSSDAKYPYRGTEGTTCTIIRSGTSFKDTMIRLGCNVILQNVTLDGGSEKGLIATPTKASGMNAAGGGLIVVTAKGGIRCELGEGAVLQNSHTTTVGGAVNVDWSDFVLNGGTIVNCVSDVNGGAIYMNSQTKTNPARGYTKLESGTISGCSAANGGAVYVNKGTLQMNAARILECTASTSGGGIYLTPEDKMAFVMTGGTISGCSALNGSGGGIYVASQRSMNMSGGFIMGCSAKSSGGGIAVDSGAVLTFSRTPWISGNTSTASVAQDKACNLELGLNSNTVINTNGIWNGAKIGVYVPGADNGSEATSSQYDKHGGEDDPFGTFKALADSSYLYGFVNDRNGLRGGLKSGKDPVDYKIIHWIKIFSLEISTEVSSYLDESAAEFYYTVTLSGTAFDGTVAEDINSTPGEPEKYGSVYFVNGVATQMVVKDGDTIRLVDLKLKAGESIAAERLPAGLNFTVEGHLSASQAKYYATKPDPDNVIKGYIGEYAERTDRNRYVSNADYLNLRPICKLVSDEDGMLYTKTTIEYNWRNLDGTTVVKTENKYQPAVFSTVEEALALLSGSEKLYFKSHTGTYLEYTDQDYSLELLTNCTLAEAATIPSGKTVTLRSATKQDDLFPFQGAGTTAVLARGNFNDASMFTVEGELILENVVLDGAKSTQKAVTADGGIVNVPADGKLTVKTGAILRNSATSGNGGAIYVADEGTVTVSGGTINANAVRDAGLGAGIYLAEGARLNLSGNPYFGGTGVYNDGSMNLTVGNIQGGANRQDIYIAGYHDDAEDATNAESLVIDGDLLSGGGTIWVWAEEEPHYRTQQQFAKYTEDVRNPIVSMAALRNARPDTETGADQVGHYLYGVTKEDDTERNVYWVGVEGAAWVMLVKVLENSAGGSDAYEALSGRRFTIYSDAAMTVVAKGTVDTASGVQETINLENLLSGEGGAFFIGELAYGSYYVREQGVSGRFVFTVDDGGVVIVTAVNSIKVTTPVKTLTLQ